MGDPVAQHRRLLARCDPVWYGLRDDPPAPFGALRAAVELHRPGDGRDTAPECCSVCADEGDPYSGLAVWPCKTIRAVAEVLGVDLDG